MCDVEINAQMRVTASKPNLLQNWHETSLLFLCFMAQRGTQGQHDELHTRTSSLTEDLGEPRVQGAVGCGTPSASGPQASRARVLEGLVCANSGGGVY